MWPILSLVKNTVSALVLLIGVLLLLSGLLYISFNFDEEFSQFDSLLVFCSLINEWYISVNDIASSIWSGWECASLANRSAISLPFSPVCDGIQISFLLFECVSCAFIRLIILLWCVLLLAVAFITDRLSENMAIGFGLLYVSASKMALDSAKKMEFVGEILTLRVIFRSSEWMA